MTDACENITFPQLLLRTVNIPHITVSYILTVSTQYHITHLFPVHVGLSLSQMRPVWILPTRYRPKWLIYGTGTGTGKWWVSILCYVLDTLHKYRVRYMESLLSIVPIPFPVPVPCSVSELWVRESSYLNGSDSSSGRTAENLQVKRYTALTHRASYIITVKRLFTLKEDETNSSDYISLRLNTCSH